MDSGKIRKNEMRNFWEILCKIETNAFFFGILRVVVFSHEDGGGVIAASYNAMIDDKH